MSASDLAGLLASRQSLLLDFDGPVCGIFAHHPAPLVADALRTTLRAAGIDVPSSIGAERDPLEVLRWSASLEDRSLVRAVDQRLCEEERRAALSATPTRFARETIVAAFEAGKPLAIVSNNCELAISTYLERHRLARYVTGISARAFEHPELMKPNPTPILHGAASVASDASTCVLIGDSMADILGAQAARVAFIGFANKPEKAQQFRGAGAGVIVTSMADIALSLFNMKL